MDRLQRVRIPERPLDELAQWLRLEHHAGVGAIMDAQHRPAAGGVGVDKDLVVP